MTTLCLVVFYVSAVSAFVCALLILEGGNHG